MTGSPDEPESDGRPDQVVLRAAQALVFVDDLENLSLRSDDAHHLTSVLRLSNGASVVASDGHGRFRVCQFAGAKKRQNDIDEPRLFSADPIVVSPDRSPVSVGFSLVKGDRNDWAVQKLTELGVDRIIPIVADRSVVQLDEARRQKRVERFRRIAREAAAQSRRTTLPVIEEISTIDDLLTDCENVAIAEPGGGPLGAATTTILVGPEGGWSENELARGLTRVHLGPTILRAETAAIVAGVRLTTRRSDRI